MFKTSQADEAAYLATIGLEYTLEKMGGKIFFCFEKMTAKKQAQDYSDKREEVRQSLYKKMDE